MRKIIILSLIMLLNGCIGVGLYESPELTTSKESTMELGMPLFFSFGNTQFAYPYPELMSRRRVGKNSEMSIRWPTFFYLSGGITAGLSGEYRYLVKNLFLTTHLGFVVSTKSILVYGGPGIFLRTPDKKNILGVQLTGGVTNEGSAFPYLYRIYFARVFKSRRGKLQPGIQFVVDREGNVGTVLEIGFRKVEEK